VSLASFAAAAETTNVVDRAVELGSQAERLGHDSVWLASRVSDRDAGLASSLPNVGQQVGGSIGLAILGTVAWTVVSNTARNPAAAAAAAAKAGHPLAGTAAQVKAAIYDHALSAGFGRGFEVSAGIMLIALIITIAAVRVRRADLAGAQAALASPAGDDVSAEMLEAG
jgi:hypothetical protein